MIPAPSPVFLIVGILLCYAALATALFLFVIPRTPRNLLNRERKSGSATSPHLSSLAVRTTGVVDSILKRRNLKTSLAGALDDAGLKTRPAEFVVLTTVGAILAACVGLVIGGPFMSLLLAIAAPLAAKFWLQITMSRRRKQFADQLDDTLQLLAGGLRAGHSLLRAIDAVATDSESPTSEEFSRIVNETRLGRDLGDALDDAAERMQSEDFSWISQAIAIHREVGGNLATVLDQVGQTIRERNQIRRQVQALSAEGKLSAIILMALPFALGGILLFISPGYMDPLLQHPIGYVLMAACAVLLVVGALWLRKVVTFKF